MTHKHTTIEFDGKEGSWKVVYVPGHYSNPVASVYLNDKLFLKMDSYSTKAAKNPTKTQAASIIAEARKIVKENELPTQYCNCISGEEQHGTWHCKSCNKEIEKKRKK